ncbi:MAG: acyl-CoA reductase [Taibaiella sp.]|nr:acyl-CoA reductase [Taibaiella sp.]
MLSLERRIELLDLLSRYMLSDDKNWIDAKLNATNQNAWFKEEHIDMAVRNIAIEYLQKHKLQNWTAAYELPTHFVMVGIVMAGNIPLVGFHDFLCGFISGHFLSFKLSSKDSVLLTHLINKLSEWEPLVGKQVVIADNLKGCDAYIATGSNNTARYFEQYFGKYPHIIRKNRTSVAILDGKETDKDLDALALDVFSYYGLGCRNVTQIYVPEGYDPKRLLTGFSKYEELSNHHKYRNNYDYYLAIYLLNKVPYITNGAVLLVENKSPFSAVSIIHYQFYTNKVEVNQELINSIDIQAVIGNGYIPFGKSQSPTLSDYADNVDTLAFLCNVSS